MKKILVLFTICLPFVGSLPVAADVCDLEPVPAATLLLPYFEVGDGVTTLFSINNAAPEPALVLVTLWTDWGAPTIYFHVYLTGFDVVRINLADVFEGNIPITADEQSDPDDTVSPSGGSFHPPTPEWDGSFPDCDQFFPFFENPVVRGTALDRLQQGHTGGAVVDVDGQCLGADHGDGVARGFLTVDSVNRCTLTFMDDPEFFAEENGIANGRNVLFGDFFIVDTEQRYAEGNALVHVEAVDSLEEIPTGTTFYGRFAAGGADLREPLGTVWASPYLANGSIDGHSDLLVWRDPTVGDMLPDGASCGDVGSSSGPSWFPLNETEVVAFNEAEDVVSLCGDLGGVIPVPGTDEIWCFPYATGRYRMGEFPLDAPFVFGWAWLNLNLPGAAEGVVSQSHVTAIHRAPGFYSVGVPALRLESACSDADPSLVETWQIPPF